MNQPRRQPLSPPASFGVSLNDREFEQVRQLIAREVGIQLGDSKRALVVARLGPRLRELRLRSFAEYYDYLQGAHPEERVHFIDSLCTNETSFFREKWQFDYIENTVVPGWRSELRAGRRDRVVRVWSAACSTGEEPYSIAMLLGHHLPRHEGWTIEVLATDVSSRVLRDAEAGTFKLDRSHNIPTNYLRAFMLRGTLDHDGFMKAAPELREMIRFQPFNLQSRDYPKESFDLVFCRNVLIYFDAEARLAIVDKLSDCLAADGHLFVGHAEGIVGRTGHLRTVAPSVYAFTDASREAQRARRSR